MHRFSSRPQGSATDGRDGRCVFCDVISGRTPARAVAEDERALAFLDAHPLLKGHVLLVPKAHITVLPEADDDTLHHLARWLRTLSAAVPSAMGAAGSFIAQNNIVSQSVPHLHFHIVPRRQGDKLFARNLSWARVSYGEGEAEDVAARIRAEVAKVGQP
jgi:histidine triad (HIT) family protein